MTIVTFTQIINMSQSTDVNEREEAARLLSNFTSNEKAEKIILSLLRDENWRVRKSAIETVLASHTESLLKGVVELLYDDDNVGARNAAMDILLRLGSDALPFIKMELNTTHPDVKLFLASMLGEMQDHKMLPFLYKCLKDENENVIAVAIVSLGKIGDVDAIPYLFEFLQSSNPWYQYQAIEALGLIGHSSAISKIVPYLDNAFLRPAVVRALSQIDDEQSIITLCDCFNKEPSIELANALFNLIFQNRPPSLWNNLKEKYKKILKDNSSVDSINRLFAILNNESPENQFNILMLFAFMNIAEVIDFIKPFLQSPDSMYKAIEILKLYSPNEIFKLKDFVGETNDDILLFEYITLFNASTDSTHANYIENYLSHPNEQIKIEAYKIIHNILKKGSYYYLLDALNDENEKLSEFAAMQLIEMAKGDSALQKKLEEDVTNLVDLPSDNLKALTIYILYSINPLVHIHKVYEGLKSASSIIRYRSLQCIIKEDNNRAFNYIKSALVDEDQKIRELAVSLLGKMPSEETTKLLISALDDEDIWVRIEAIKSLSLKPNIQIFDLLKQRYDYSPMPLKIEILKFMGKFDIEASREFLCAQLSNEDDEIRSTAAQNLSPSDKKSIDILINTAKLDKNWLIRKEAIKSLSKVKMKNFENLLFEIAKNEADLYVKKTLLEIMKSKGITAIPEYIFKWIYEPNLVENIIELLFQQESNISYYLNQLPYRIKSKIEKTLSLLKG